MFGDSGSIELVPSAGYAFELPEDLLAVLGRDWGLLRRRRAGWIGSVRARGKIADRSRQIERKLERLVTHLAATLDPAKVAVVPLKQRMAWDINLVWRRDRAPHRNADRTMRGSPCAPLKSFLH